MSSVHNLLGNDKVHIVLYADKWPFLEWKCISREEGGLEHGWKISKILEAYRNVLGSDFLCTSQQNREMQNFVADIH
jgi:hypothetical protein